MAAHLGAMVMRGGGVGAAGIVLSMSLNGASTSFANPLTGGAGLIGSLGSTVWGQELSAMFQALPRGMVL